MARRNKKSGVSCLTIVILAAVALWAFCNRDDQPGGGNKFPFPVGKPPKFDFPGEIELEKNPEIIRIATFNIQVLGESKMKVARDAAMLGQIIRQFDVVAVQELRAKEGDRIIAELLQYVNSDGANYVAEIGPRLGRTNSKEQYIFIYDSDRIELFGPPDPFTYESRNRLHRDPHVARFKVKTVPLEETFTFTLINIHTDPDLADEEVDYLADVYRNIRRKWAEDDVILLGDLNAKAKKLGELGEVPGIMWVVGGEITTNTRGTEQYDNILFDKDSTREFTGDYGVYDFETRFELSRKQALELSDHFPVWAEFTIREAK